MTVTKPIDLIVANTLHMIVEKEALLDQLIAKLPRHKRESDAANRAKSDIVRNEATARQMLCTISHESPITVVLTLLAAAGAPGSLELIGEGIQAVKDRQA